MDIKLNQDELAIQVDLNSLTIARGTWTVDIPDKTILVHFQELNLPSLTTVGDDDEELRNFFSNVTIFYSKIYDSKIFYYTPSLCNRKMIESKSKSIMTVEKKNFKQLQQNFNFDQSNYTVITDKKEIHLYVQSLVEMLRVNAFWLTKCDENELKSRIDSSSRIIMVLYKDNNNDIPLPVGFARLFTTMDRSLTYMSDVAIAISHQSKGLASYMIDYFFKIFLDDEDNSSSNEKEDLLCLLCADQGNGMHSAPKLYKKFGFEFLTDSKKNVPLLLDDIRVKSND